MGDTTIASQQQPMTDGQIDNFVDKFRAAFKRFLRKENPRPSIRELGGTIVLPRTGGSLAREKFVAGSSSVRIGFVDKNFQKWFGGKVVELEGEPQLFYAMLTKPSCDGEILSTLGDKPETTLGPIYALMLLQSDGEDGVLLTNGHANIFYVEGEDGELRALGVCWLWGAAWCVGARSVSDPGRWHEGSRVFCGDSLKLGS